MLVRQSQDSLLPKIAWDLPLMTLGELHIPILPNTSWDFLPVNEYVPDFSFAEDGLITSHSEKRFSEFPWFPETLYFPNLGKLS